MATLDRAKVLEFARLLAHDMIDALISRGVEPGNLAKNANAWLHFKALNCYVHPQSRGDKIASSAFNLIVRYAKADPTIKPWAKLAIEQAAFTCLVNGELITRGEHVAEYVRAGGERSAEAYEEHAKGLIWTVAPSLTEPDLDACARSAPGGAPAEPGGSPEAGEAAAASAEPSEAAPSASECI